MKITFTGTQEGLKLLEDNLQSWFVKCYQSEHFHAVEKIDKYFITIDGNRNPLEIIIRIYTRPDQEKIGEANIALDVQEFKTIFEEVIL